MPPLRRPPRKRLGFYSYKFGKNYKHKKPGLIPIERLNNLQSTIKDKTTLKIILRKERRESEFLMGRFTSKGFQFDPTMAPKVDIPDLTDFELKPYISVHTPTYEKKMKPDSQFNMDPTYI